MRRTEQEKQRLVKIALAGNPFKVDRQFLAAHVLRFIGYVLHTVAGQTCAGLYVPGATEDIFGGAWTDNVCSAR